MRRRGPYNSYKQPAGLLGLVFVCTITAGLLMGCSPEGQRQSTPGDKPAGAVSISGKGAVSDGNPEAGKAIYNKYCHFCHGKKGLGDGPIGIAITPHPADFVHDTKRMRKTDRELFKSITEGIHRDVGGEEMQMPRWAEVLSVQERLDVLAYVRVLERMGKAAEQETPESGR